jgi:hypothetical protein
MTIPSKAINFIGFNSEYCLPSAIFNNHSITKIMIEGNEYLKCSNLDCNFSMRGENATAYQQYLNKTKSFVNGVKGYNKIEHAKQRIIDQILSISKERELVPSQAINLLEMLLTKIFDDTSSDNTAKVNHLDIEKNINRFNQICPLKEENFENDFFAGDYADKLKQTCHYSAEDFQDAPAKKFIVNHFTAVQSLINHLCLKKIPYAEACDVSLLENNEMPVSLIINKPDLTPNNLQRENFLYITSLIESGKNGADVFRKLEFAVKADIAFLKLKKINPGIFSRQTNAYIPHWVAISDYIKIFFHTNSKQHSIDNNNFKEYKISLTNVLDINLCEINIEKLKEELEKIAIKYDDLICNAPREGGLYFEAIAL